MLGVDDVLIGADEQRGHGDRGQFVRRPVGEVQHLPLVEFA